MYACLGRSIPEITEKARFLLELLSSHEHFRHGVINVFISSLFCCKWFVKKLLLFIALTSTSHVHIWTDETGELRASQECSPYSYFDSILKSSTPLLGERETEPPFYSFYILSFSLHRHAHTLSLSLTHSLTHSLSLDHILLIIRQSIV